MKVLVSDKLSDDGVARLKESGILEVDVNVGLGPEALKEIIGNYDAIIIRSATKLTKEILEKADRLKGVVRAGVGVDNVDLAYAKSRGIAVMNTPGGATSAVAELALAMMLALARRLHEADGTMKEGKWEKKAFEGNQLGGKTLGVIGLGRIGRKLAEFVRGVGMEVVGYDPIFTNEVDGVRRVELDELYRVSDYISLHVPLTPDTKQMINKDSLGMMKKGVRIINCARGGTVNEKDLAAALDSGHVAGAGFDVFETEPPVDMVLSKHPKCIATPHVGAATREAQASVGQEAADIIVHLAKTGEYLNRLV